MEKNEKRPAETCCLMSLRAENVRPMFEQRDKQYEYRTWFPWKFKGRVFVYESGQGSRHAVVGFYDVRVVFTLEGGKQIPPQMQPFLDKTCPWSLQEFNEVQETLEVGQRICAIPVFAPRMFFGPMPLPEFNRRFDVRFAPDYRNPRDTDITRPPMSWRLITTSHDGDAEAYPPIKRRRQ